ncbi:N-acetylmuramoyl-L-alanine amidase family protein [Caldisalinibacter kiritimatiensis]|uniref:N-acetylmuramoyl-L-alanine amidase n=1 Tax=Caldisalinibacter kiritimatiensis TaxID=1304284 RepID=R1CY77_9FIRM|nr:N-acetylmuramoyl-L-alanine amidase [Caldisalinibacter kiritimatiensis]EOD01529.1 N-acetylmuramoyl-L-alanine amidase [Caldisalinibacter kiritimatiensis]
MILLIFSVIFIITTIFFKYHKCYQGVFNAKFRNGTVVIDPGHGGIDGGAHYKEYLLEKNINLDVALRLKNFLLKQRTRVIMTRDKDVSLEDKSTINDTRYKRDLDARKKIINTNNPDVFVSIHVNANSFSSKARGVVIYYYPGSIEGERLAEEISKAIDCIVYEKYLKYEEIRSKIVAEDYYITRETKVPGVIVEMGFITNPCDRKLFQNNTYKQKIAEAIGWGIMNYLK